MSNNNMTPPSIRIEPPRSGTDGEGAGMLSAAYNVILDEWQQLVLDCWLGRDEKGAYTTISGGLSVPRQNGKNCVVEARELYGLLVNGERILHTAHQGRTAKKSFRRLVKIFEDKTHPEITGLVKQIYYGTGEEHIELKNGGVIEFSSRSRQAARGFDGLSLLVIDEAQELTNDQLEALLAVLSASQTGQRQIIYLGTPPYPGCPGDVFRRFRQGCIKGAEQKETAKNSWHEWGLSAADLDSVDLSDKKLWYQCNPALGVGGRLSVEFTQEEYKTLSPDGFARERLGWWAPPAVTACDFAIDADLWDSCKSNDPKPAGKTAYAVKFSADGSEVALAGAVIPETGSPRIALIAVEPTGAGLSWLAKWLNERYKQACAVAVDGRNGADVLIDKLRPSGGGTWVFKDSIIKPSAQNVVTAAQGLLGDLAEHAVTWYGEQEELRESAISVTKRPIGGGFGFGGQNSAPIEACSLALWACKTSKRNPTRQMRIG